MTYPHPFPAAPTRVIRVHGDDRAIGRQHAELLGDEVRRGMPSFYYEMWKRLTTKRPSNPLAGAAFTSAVWAVDRMLIGKLGAQIPEPMKERLRGIEEVTGIAYRELLTAMVLPDLMPMLQAYLVKWQPARFLEYGDPPRFGCSSFLSAGERFLVGRNLDFPGVSYWDRFPVMQMTEMPGKLKYLAFTSAGVPIAGITGVNEAQVSVHLHQHYCRTSSLSGRLPFVIAEEILGNARTAGEAMTMLQGQRVASSWAFVVADGKTREGFIAEVQPSALGVRPFHRGDPAMAHSNYYQTAECRPAEYATTERMNWDNYWRKTRLETLVRNAGEKLTAAAAVQCLSEHFDGYWGEEKPVNRTVSQLYNIQSLVLDLETMRVYFAEGDSPIHLRDYREYDLGAIFAGKEGRTDRALPAYHFRDSKKREAKEAYVRSFVEGFDGRWEPALEAMRRSLDASYSAEGALVAALVQLKLGAFDGARDTLEGAKHWLEDRLAHRAAEMGQALAPPPEYFEACLYLARVYDLLGRRDAALATYEAVAKHPECRDGNIRRLATAARPFRTANVDRIVMPYSSYIPFA